MTGNRTSPIAKRSSWASARPQPDDAGDDQREAEEADGAPGIPEDQDADERRANGADPGPDGVRRADGQLAEGRGEEPEREGHRAEGQGRLERAGEALCGLTTINRKALGGYL